MYYCSLSMLSECFSSCYYHKELKQTLLDLIILYFRSKEITGCQGLWNQLAIVETKAHLSFTWLSMSTPQVSWKSACPPVTLPTLSSSSLASKASEAFHYSPSQIAIISQLSSVSLSAEPSRV